MSTKDTATEILKRMEEGTQAIYAQYREKARQATAAYQQKLTDLETDYRENSRVLSGAAALGLDDRLTALSDLGLQNSGAAQQARISSKTALLGSLGQLSVQRAKDRSAAKASYDAQAASIAAEEQEKVEQYRDTMTKLLIEQQNKDREYEAKQQQAQQNLAIQQEKLALQQQSAAAKQTAAKQSAAKKSSTSGTAQKKEAGVTPSQSANKLMDTIVKASRKYNKKERYYYVDRSLVQKAIMQVLNDERITKTYRYQFYTQARAMGYVA